MAPFFKMYIKVAVLCLFNNYFVLISEYDIEQPNSALRYVPDNLIALFYHAKAILDSSPLLQNLLGEQVLTPLI